jgi:hypothetical protein
LRWRRRRSFTANGIRTRLFASLFRGLGRLLPGPYDQPAPFDPMLGRALVVEDRRYHQEAKTGNLHGPAKCEGFLKRRTHRT